MPPFWGWRTQKTDCPKHQLVPLLTNGFAHPRSLGTHNFWRRTFSRSGARHLDRPKYDFVYLPWATRKACNIGLALLGMEILRSSYGKDVWLCCWSVSFDCIVSCFVVWNVFAVSWFHSHHLIAGKIRSCWSSFRIFHQLKSRPPSRKRVFPNEWSELLGLSLRSIYQPAKVASKAASSFLHTRLRMSRVS